MTPQIEYNEDPDNSYLTQLNNKTNCARLRGKGLRVGQVGRNKGSDQLTARELEILRLIADGLSNQAIAARLYISLGTVKWYLKQIYSKLQVESRTQAIAIARTLGLLDVLPVALKVSTARHNLPYQPTPFIGRTEELAAIARDLENPACRLLSLVGPGGIGKTRLALQAAEQQISNFAHGVYFVSLAPISSPESIVSTIAGEVQLLFYGVEAPDLQLLNCLREKHMLLVFDNFDHLLEGAPLINTILASALKLKILVTSRERLKLQVEWVLPVQGMSYPGGTTLGKIESYSAVELFAQSAGRIQPTFSLPSEQVAVIDICRSLEGMPLGIELAAMWLRVMTCSQIAAQIGHDLSFLTTSQRDVLQRHKSLRTVFEHSWRLLSEAERRVMARLSIFRRGFDLEAAEEVAEATLPILANLADKSLIRLTPSGRYDMH